MGQDQLDVDNIVDTRRVTRSGRIISPQDMHDKADALARAKDKKQVVDDAPIQDLDANMTKDVEEIMRYIRKSDYRVIDQLG